MVVTVDLRFINMHFTLCMLFFKMMTCSTVDNAISNRSRNSYEFFGIFMISDDDS